MNRHTGEMDFPGGSDPHRGKVPGTSLAGKPDQQTADWNTAALDGQAVLAEVKADLSVSDLPDCRTRESQKGAVTGRGGITGPSHNR